MLLSLRLPFGVQCLAHGIVQDAPAMIVAAAVVLVTACMVVVVAVLPLAVPSSTRCHLVVA